MTGTEDLYQNVMTKADRHLKESTAVGNPDSVRAAHVRASVSCVWMGCMLAVVNVLLVTIKEGRK